MSPNLFGIVCGPDFAERFRVIGLPIIGLIGPNSISSIVVGMCICCFTAKRMQQLLKVFLTPTSEAASACSAL